MVHVRRIRPVALALALLATVPLGGCELFSPGPDPIPRVTTSVTIDPSRPQLTIAPGDSAEVQLVNAGNTRVDWQGESDIAGVTIEPASGVLVPAGRRTVTLRATPGAAGTAGEVWIRGGGSRARLDVTVGGAAAPPPLTRLRIGQHELQLGDNTLGAVVLDPPSGAPSSAWTLRSEDPFTVAVEGADASGESSGEVAGGARTPVQVYAQRASVETTSGSYGAELLLTTPAGEHRIAVEFPVTDTPAVNRCPAARATARHGAAATAGGVLNVTRADPRSAAEAPVFAPGQVIVGYRGTAALGADPGAGIAASYGLRVLRAGGPGAPDLLRIPAGADPRAVAARLEGDPRIAFAEPNRYLYAQRVTDDPLLGDQWALCYFGAPVAWNLSRGDDAIVVAVIDEGVDTDHPDLVDRLLPGIDLCPVQTPCPDDLSFDDDPNTRTSHGSHVSGIVAATGDNGLGVAGVANGGTRILPIKVFNDFGGAPDTFVVAQAIRWAVGIEVPGLPRNPTPARIVNLSLGGCDPAATAGCGSNRTLESAAADAAGAGALLLASSGNDRSRTPWNGVLYPANGPDVLAVGSVNSNRQRSSFSRFDADGGPTVDLMAPGGFFVPGNSGLGILSTENEGTYGLASGTSMASPYAAGVAALLWSTDLSMSAVQVRTLLLERAVADPDWDAFEYGAGIVCPDAVLQRRTRCSED